VGLTASALVHTAGMCMAGTPSVPGCLQAMTGLPTESRAIVQPARTINQNHKAKSYSAEKFIAVAGRDKVVRCMIHAIACCIGCSRCY
jgi:hypothetical protein